MSDLSGRISRYGNMSKLAELMGDIWPDHAAFVAKSLLAHDDADLPLLEHLSGKIITLAGDRLSEVLGNYQWLCGVIYEEQVYFARNKKYRNSSFAEANATVYSNAEFMGRYMEGLLVSQLFWENHAKTYIFHARLVAGFPPGYCYLEIGPGHGLFLADVASSDACAAAEAWDISAESLVQTAASIRKMGVAKPVKLVQMDVNSLQPDQLPGQFDLVVISEVLEHLEHPAGVLAKLGLVLAPGGKIFINVPVNSPAPDHIYLLGSPDAALELVRSAGFKVEAAEYFPATGYSLERAIRARATISCAIIARFEPAR